MLKIVCLIQDEPALFYFVNRINEKHKVSLAVIERPPGKKAGMKSTVMRIANNLFKGSRKAEYKRIHNEVFGHKWERLDKDIPLLNVESINSDIVLKRLKKEQPDIILDHGTSIVKDHILDTAELTLNLHWGLSPYYRGSYCTEWALTNWDPYNIGVTVHKLSNIIDGGEILAQERLEISPGDTVHSINMKLTGLGTDLIIKALDKLTRGEELQFEKQDLSMGFTNYVIHRTKYIRKNALWIERNNLIEVMLKKPSRKQRMPIVKMK